MLPRAWCLLSTLVVTRLSWGFVEGMGGSGITSGLVFRERGVNLLESISPTVLISCYFSYRFFREGRCLLSTRK